MTQIEIAGLIVGIAVGIFLLAKLVKSVTSDKSKNDGHGGNDGGDGGGKRP